MSGKQARPTLDQREEWRKKIQASQLLNALGNHVAGKIEMSATQVNAAKILLAKVLPDVKAMEITGNNGAPLETVTRVELVPGGNGTDSAAA